MLDNTSKLNILLIEDNPGDIRLTREALKESKLLINLITVVDGEEATDYLFKKDKYQNAVTPDLILLDLNLPKKNGQEVLAEIKKDLTLRVIPVVILTTSGTEEDILSSYDLNANCFIQKPLDMMQFVKIVQQINDFWLTIVKLPPIK